MEKKTSAFLSIEKIKFLLSALFILAIIFAGIFLFNRLKTETSVYRIENKYYGFEIKTPKGWFAEGKTLYSEENIAQLLQRCQNDEASESSGYEIGHFKFKSQKYPQNFDLALYSASDFSSGIILDIAINCVPSLIKNKETGYGYGDIDIGGEKALAGFLNYPSSNQIKDLSFFHDGLQYAVREYVYISLGDKESKEKKLTAEYDKIFSGIVSSFKFIK